MFVELLLITVLTESQRGEEPARSEEMLMNIFLKVRDTPNMIQGLQFFVKKVLKKTDVAGSKQDKEKVNWGCRVIDDTLKALASKKIVQT